MMIDLLQECFLIPLIVASLGNPLQAFKNDSDFCKDKSNICIQFCCPEGQFEDIYRNCTPYQGDNINWKPKALIEAEVRGKGRALFDRDPDIFCPNGSFRWPSFSRKRSIKILNNGLLDWGMYYDKLTKTVPNLKLIISGGMIWPKEFYCVTNVERIIKGNKTKFFQRYNLCIDQAITRSCLEKWQEIFDFGLFPGLFIVSMIFLILTFALVYHEQREKLYG